LGVATCGGAGGSVAWRLERWRERERERNRGERSFFWPNLNPICFCLHREKISALDSVGEDPNR